MSEVKKNLILFQKNIAHPIPPILENVGLGGLRSQDYKVWMPSTRPEIHKNLCILLSSAFFKKKYAVLFFLTMTLRAFYTVCVQKLLVGCKRARDSVQNKRLPNEQTQTDCKNKMYEKRDKNKSQNKK